MSFTKPVEVKSVGKCWNRAYRWLGGEKEIVLEDGRKVKELRPNVMSYNAETEQKEYFDPNMKMAVVGFTTGVTGFVPGQTAQDKGIRYFSNEVVDSFSQPIKVFKVDGTGTNVIFDGLYSAVKNNKPQGLKFVNYLYFYDFDTKVINRFEITGAALGPWFKLDKADGVLHKRWLKIMPGDTKRVGQNDFIEPVLEYGDLFSQAEIDEIVNSEAYKTYDMWEQKLRDNQVDTGDFAVDQTPAQYEGEGSQEYPDASTARPASAQNTTDLTNVPF